MTGLLRAYLQRGWAILVLYGVFEGRCVCSEGAECASPGKHPRSRHGLDDATTSERELVRLTRRWTGSNFGLVTGPDTALVIDIDGPEGVDALHRRTQQHGPLPTGVGIVHTGRGAHLYLKGTDVPNRAGILPRVDVRGRRGYCVVPPSTHLNGARYQWERGVVPEVSALPPAPAWLRDLIVPPRIATPIRLPTRRGPQYGLAALRDECALIAATPKGNRNHQLNKSAYKLGQLAAGGQLDVETALGALIGAGLQAGLSETECRKTAASGFRAGLANPRGIAS